MNYKKIIDATRVDKDVDGFNQSNVTDLVTNDTQPLFVPCAARACVRLLHCSKVQIKGKKTVVIGHNRMIGSPMFCYYNLKKKAKFM